MDKPTEKKTIPADLHLEGEHVLLKPSGEWAFPILKEILSDTKTMAHLHYLAKQEQGGWTLEDVRQREKTWQDRQLDQKCAHFICVDKSSEAILGTCGLFRVDLEHKTAEYGAIIDRRHWGSGVASECKFLNLEYGFEVLQLNRIQFVTFSHNTRNRKFKERLGIHLECIRRHSFIEQGIVRDEAIYVVLKEEWPELKKRLRSRSEAQRSST